MKTKCGSPSYASPELIAQPFYDGFKSDIWCCGIILYAMLCGYLPFDGDEDKDGNDVLFKNIIEGNLEIPKYISNIAKDLIVKLLNVDAKERITIPEIKKHPFYIKGKKQFKNSSIEKNIELKNNQNNNKENITLDAIKNDTFVKDMNDNKFDKKISYDFHNLSPNYNKNINIITNNHGLYREQINCRNKQILNTEGNKFINPLSMFNATKKNNLIYKLFDTKLNNQILEKSKINNNNFLSIENQENKILKQLIKKNLTDKNNSLYYKAFGNLRKNRQSNPLHLYFDRKLQYSNDSRTFGDEVFLRNFRKTLLNKEKNKREKNLNKSNDKYRMKLKINNIDNFEKKNITLSTENKIKRKNLYLKDNKEIYINHLDIIPNNIFSINSEIKIPNTRYNNPSENIEHIFINDNNSFTNKSNSINVNNKNYSNSLNKYGKYKSENNYNKNNINKIENLNRIIKIGNQNKNKMNSNSIIRQKTKNFLNKFIMNHKTIEPYNLNKRNNTIEINRMPTNLSKKIKDYIFDNNGHKLKSYNEGLINQLFSNNKRKNNNMNVNGNNKNILPILADNNQNNTDYIKKNAI